MYARAVVSSLTIFLLLVTGCENFGIQPGISQSAPVAAVQPEPLPAPADLPVAATDQAEVTVETAPLVATDLWQRLRNGFQLDHEVDRKRVEAELRWYLNNPDYVHRVSKRAAPHLHFIIEELEKRGMPLEFALLPVVESAYDPFAYSHGRAAGLWQFIPSTARVYGLKIDWWYDGRRDVRASTLAALDYLQHLNSFFDGDWLLALAAYNAGEGNVLSSIRASKQHKSEASFWTLKVFRETYTYVPRLLAISELFSNPGKYQITLPALENKSQWSVVSTGAQLDLHKAADLAGITPEQLYRMNAGYNQWATHPDGPHELILPVAQVEQFNASLSGLDPADRVAWKRHKVKNGENLGIIAQRYRTTIATIRQVNNLEGNMIRAGSSLLIPGAGVSTDYTMSATGRLASKQEALTKRYGEQPVIHEVRSGDSFWNISRKYGVGMRELALWNGLGTTSTLYPGMKLKVFKASRSAAPELRPKLSQQVRKLNYRVRSGESLSLIASKFNVTIENIKSWNQAVSVGKYIHPGDRLTLYVDVTSLIN
jgi:membrane-bound lytic murein transglycosylase D